MQSRPHSRSASSATARIWICCCSASDVVLQQRFTPTTVYTPARFTPTTVDAKPRFTRAAVDTKPQFKTPQHVLFQTVYTKPKFTPTTLCTNRRLHQPPFTAHHSLHQQPFTPNNGLHQVYTNHRFHQNTPRPKVDPNHTRLWFPPRAPSFRVSLFSSFSIFFNKFGVVHCTEQNHLKDELVYVDCVNIGQVMLSYGGSPGVCFLRVCSHRTKPKT